MLIKIDKRFRSFLGKRLGLKIPSLYSTVDNPLEIPVQKQAYELAIQKYMYSNDHVLDVGLGLGYGLRLMSSKAHQLTGIDIDKKAINYAKRNLKSMSVPFELMPYNGKKIPYPDKSFDLVTCIDVIEHVPDYVGLINEMVRVARRIVLVSTPNRRPENTNQDGSPRNYWHLREWSFIEFDQVLQQITGIQVEWNTLNGPMDGPFIIRDSAMHDTQALTPALLVN